MQPSAQLLRQLPIDETTRNVAQNHWLASDADGWSDAQLADTCAAAIVLPKMANTSSFVLHAPLELAARFLLLPHVDPCARSDARRRIAAIAARYAAMGDEVLSPTRSFHDSNQATQTLLQSLDRGDVAAADTAIGFLQNHQHTATLCNALADAVAPRLGAAAHAPILLSLLPRITSALPHAAGLLRAPIRTLAAQFASQLNWHRRATTSGAQQGSAQDAMLYLHNALLNPPHVASSSAMIAPTLLSVEKSGEAQRLLGPISGLLTVQQARQVLLRVAAYAMLGDDAASAAYGWSHCLTLPQAILTNAHASADPNARMLIAATHVLAFRATLSNTRIAADMPPPLAPAEALNMRTQLASFAATHEDAHLVKYTLACFDAARDDPEAEPLFLAAAAHLGEWWRARARR
jgi:hypothetical protein